MASLGHPIVADARYNPHKATNAQSPPVWIRFHWSARQKMTF